MKQRAFTLMELMIVIVIIGILSAVGMVMFGGQSEKAKIAAMQTIHNKIVKTVAFEMMKCQLGETRIFSTSKYGGPYSTTCGTTPNWLAASARNGIYNSAEDKNPWKPKDFAIWEVTGKVGYFEKGRVIVTSSGNEVRVRSCWADGCDSSNRKLNIIIAE